MRCQECGRSEVSFHYSSNINGHITEAHLCGECASKVGFGLGSGLGSGLGRGFGVESVFDAIFPAVSRQGGLTQRVVPVGLVNAALPYPVWAPPATEQVSDDCACGNCKCAPESTEAQIDDEMKSRRELNMQLRAAVESEDYETAAQLRDKLKGVENEG